MRLIASALMIACLAGPALADQTVTLKNDATAEGPVTLGDLFDGAGAASGVVIAPAIKSGNLVLDVASVQQAAIRAGLVWSNEQGVRRIIIHGGAPGSALGSSGSANAGPGVAKPGAVVTVLAYARNLDSGEIIQPEDLTWAKAVSAPAGSPRDADQLIGKQAKRPLREGGFASTRDVAAAIVIKKDDMVSVHFQDSGISVSMQGKALGSAAVGDAVSILNPTAKKTIQAIASGPDEAVVGPEAERIRGQALNPASQIALR